MAEGMVILESGPHRVLKGSPWVYRTEIRPSEAEPGTVVVVRTREGKTLGRGFYNPRSMIAVRMLTWGVEEQVTPELFKRRVQDAVQLRHEVTAIGRDAYRVVHSEADRIPGLIVDKYDSMLVLQVTSLGLLPYLETIQDTLVELLHPSGIYEHGDLSVRDREGLPRVNRLLWGEIISPVDIHEHGVVVRVDIVGGQKTGHFLDQYVNRGRVAEFSAGRKVFDAFCHTGSFALVAARHGATSVVGIDIDGTAVRQAEENARLNDVQDVVQFETHNAFDWLRKESDGKAQYDLGILDPPAFTKSKQSVPQALKGYKEINLRGIKLLRPGGILVTSSCSYHLSEQDFIDVIQSAAHDAKRTVRIMEIRGQGPDHPMSPALSESRYLKCVILAVGR